MNSKHKELLLKILFGAIIIDMIVILVLTYKKSNANDKTTADKYCYIRSIFTLLLAALIIIAVFLGVNTDGFVSNFSSVFDGL